VLLLTITGVVCALFYAVITTISSLFAANYPFLTETEIGLCFLPNGIGSACGTVMTGRLADFEYRRAKKKFSENSSSGVDNEFPVERARLRYSPIYVMALVAAAIGYGWSIQEQVHISVPLICTFIGKWAFDGVVAD
jgi:hypothetical protein